MSVSGISGRTLPLPAMAREEMVAITAARPAALQQQTTALAAADRGTSGQGTPAIQPNAGVDLYA